MFEAIDKVLSNHLLAQKDKETSARVKGNNAQTIYRDARCGIYVGGEEEKMKLDQFMTDGECKNSNCWSLPETIEDWAIGHWYKIIHVK